MEINVERKRWRGKDRKRGCWMGLRQLVYARRETWSNGSLDRGWRRRRRSNGTLLKRCSSHNDNAPLFSVYPNLKVEYFING
ncbi:Hypothetical protein CINCED_3A020360 [Cinara cedri]|uniref:Uncharacterized protein n=1 Tax=Cinara cedri TaxID=506608 RepID=A0A5E4M3M9_9HEMI|nr:Hypothetical protein CINCED_3A020360 [Cinara cedri]